jgi:two-component system KDP operon response regulator KdpE
MNHSRILVVDDEPQLRRALKSTLSALGFLVSDADTGERALEMLRSEKFDLMLLDINMPGLDGIETCRAVRAKSEMGIVMLTVRGRAEDKIRALDSGADGYVTKPFDVNELLARIRATLRRTPASAPGESRIFCPEGVEINFKDRQVTVFATPSGGSGHTTRLTPKEAELLHYLVTNPNQVLSHERILQAVWGPDYGGEVEYLRVFVNQLRKKIESEPSRPHLLLTEPWLGYRFVLREEHAAAQPELDRSRNTRPPDEF